MTLSAGPSPTIGPPSKTVMNPPAKPKDASQALGLRERGKLRRTERILDAALELLREDPNQNLTVDRISERAECDALMDASAYAASLGG